MAIPLVEADEVIKGRGKTKGEKYSKYAQAIAPLVGWIKEQIKNSPDKRIRVKTNDIAKEMGGDFSSRSDSSMYYGLKFVLFHEAIVVEQGVLKGGSKVLIMREATPEDKLPPSLARVLEPSEEEMPAPGTEE